MTPGKVYEWLNFQKFASGKIWFLNFENPQNLFYKIRDVLYIFVLLNVFKEKIFTIEIEVLE